MKKLLRIACISDFVLYGRIDMKFPPDIDVLLMVGSISNAGQVGELNLFIQSFLRDIKIPVKIFIGGQRDKPLELMSPPVKNFIENSVSEGVIYLKDDSVNVNGFNIYGSPYTVENKQYPLPSTAFRVQTETDLVQHFKNIPEDTDILLTGAAPYGIMDYDRTNRNLLNPLESVGSERLRYKVEELPNLKVHVFDTPDTYGTLNKHGITFVNPKIRKDNYSYNEFNSPVILNIEK